jgi:Fur family transcriptional regulator, ferric uptake regulator
MTASGARRGRYQTRQRRAVVRTLAQVPGFLSAQALHARMHLAGETISLTTVYRALRVLADAGRIDTIPGPAGGQLFHLGTAGRSRHLVCRDCDQNVPADAGTVEDWAASTAADHGFTDIQLVIELTGLCPACTQ